MAGRSATRQITSTSYLRGLPRTKCDVTIRPMLLMSFPRISDLALGRPTKHIAPIEKGRRLKRYGGVGAVTYQGSGRWAGSCFYFSCCFFASGKKNRKKILLIE
jgi:hypothetical protein